MHSSLAGGNGSSSSGYGGGGGGRRGLTQEPLPPFEMVRLPEIELIFNQGSGSGLAKEKISNAIENLE